MSGFSEDPAAPYRARLDKASFFAWLQGQEGGRYELKDGEIIMHAGSSRRHAKLASGFVTALSTRLDLNIWLVTAADYAVEIGADIRYPDILVARDTDAAELSTSAPVLLVEILSPSSVARDMNVKLAEYTSLASLECYIVASQDEPIVWVWLRDADTREFPTLATEIAGANAKLEIPSLALALPLAEIYRGIAKV